LVEAKILTEFDPIRDTMGGQSYATGGSVMNEKSDAQVLTEAMGIEWLGDDEHGFNPRFETPAELWELLMYMMQRED